MTTPTDRPAPLIYINAFPGIGKLTIARALQPLIANSRILHNHELIDPVEEAYPREHTEYAAQRTAYRRQHLAAVAEDPGTTYIFTDAQTEYNDCVADYHALSLPPVNRRFYSIVLECETEENMRRLVSTGRGGEANGKLTNPTILRLYRETMETWGFGGEYELVLDVTTLSAEEAAGRIGGFVRGREVGRCAP